MTNVSLSSSYVASGPSWSKHFRCCRRRHWHGIVWWALCFATLCYFMLCCAVLSSLLCVVLRRAAPELAEASRMMRCRNWISNYYAKPLHVPSRPNFTDPRQSASLSPEPGDYINQMIRCSFTVTQYDCSAVLNRLDSMLLLIAHHFPLLSLIG